MADVPSLTPGTLIDGARMYAAAADAANDRFPNALHVLSHLLGMSIELTLKAYLRQRGASVGQLRRLGHDLTALLRAAEEVGLTKTGSRQFRLTVLGAGFADRIFAYPQAGMLNVIMPWSLRQIARELIEEVFIEVHGQDRFDELKDAPGIAIQSLYPDDIESPWWSTPPTVG